MKEIYSDWKKEFHSLTKIKSNSLFEKLGPLLIGIEIKKSRFTDSYAPYLSISGLWGSEVSNFKGSLNDLDCIFYKEVFFALNNLTTGGTFFISPDEHVELFREMISQMKKQFLPLEENVKKETLIDYIKWYRTKKDLMRASSEVDAQLLELKYILALYFDDRDLANEAVREIEKEKDSWHKEGFQLRFGNYNEWIKRIINLKRDDILKSIERVSNNPKIQNVKEFQLIE